MYVFTNHLIFIRINIIYVISDKYAFALSSLGWFRNPNVFVGWFSLLLHKMVVKIWIFFRQDIGVRNDVKRSFAVNFLHSENVLRKFVLPCNFKRIWEMVDLLKLIQTFINIRFWRSIDPHHVPIMTFSIVKPSCFKSWSN